jgi:hypothetical protein
MPAKYETAIPQQTEKMDMQCYQYLAATIAVSNTLESLPGVSHKLPLGVIANWMDENGIDAEDVLFASTDTIEALIEPLVVNNQPLLLAA